MATSFRGLLHRATHRVPGVPPHAERPTGHRGTAGHAHGVTPHRSLNHSPARPPRFMAAWQRRIGAFFGRES